MAGILVFVEQRNGVIRQASLQAISEAHRQAGGDVAAVLVGSGIGDAAAGLGVAAVAYLAGCGGFFSLTLPTPSATLIGRPV